MDRLGCDGAVALSSAHLLQRKTSVQQITWPEQPEQYYDGNTHTGVKKLLMLWINSKCVFHRGQILKPIHLNKKERHQTTISKVVLVTEVEN